MGTTTTMNNDSPEVRQLIASFKTCMNHLYPPVLPHLPPVGERQLRDLVRCFTMGYLEALMNTNQPLPVKALIPFYESMCDDTWQPTFEWYWWTTYQNLRQG